MLTFITAVRSEQVASDWSSICEMVEKTVSSALAQDGGNACCILACHELPFDPTPFGDRIKFLEMDYLPPRKEDLKPGDHGDKWIKLHHAMVAARDLDPSHLMILDEDDLVSRRLANTVTSRPEVDGWRFDQGYLYEGGRSFVALRRRFDKLCGSSFIRKVSPSSLPKSIDENSSDFELLRWGHTVIGDKMEEAGHKVENVAYPAAIYRVGTGENCSDVKLRSIISIREALRHPMRTHFIGKKLRREFGL